MNSVWRSIRRVYGAVFFLFAVTSYASLPLLPKPDISDTSFLTAHNISLAQPKLSWIHISAFAATAVLVPTMSILGALIANPEWLVIRELAGSKAKISYIDHTTSHATIPLGALFSFLATAPLWAVFFSEDQ